MDDVGFHAKKECSMHAGKFLEGLLLGALTGAAITILSAPQSGPATQETIRQRAKLVVDEGKRAAAERRAELEAQFAQARQSPRPTV
jgi:gas vesicle protein